jgi:hypothetical protein
MLAIQLNKPSLRCKASKLFQQKAPLTSTSKPHLAHKLFVGSFTTLRTGNSRGEFAVRSFGPICHTGRLGDWGRNPEIRAFRHFDT